MRYCEYDVDEENGGQYPGGEYEGEQDAMGTMSIRWWPCQQLRQSVRCDDYVGDLWEVSAALRVSETAVCCAIRRDEYDDK